MKSSPDAASQTLGLSSQEAGRHPCNTIVEEWLAAHGRVMFACALRLLRDPAAAEEVVQESVFQAWRDAASYDPARGPLRAWLLIITRARGLDRLRARRTRDARLAEFGRSQSWGNQQPDPPDFLHLSRRWELETVLRFLPPSDRLLVSLAYDRGLSHNDIAGCTGTALGTVKTRLRRILGLLRTAMTAQTRPFAWRTPPGGRHAVAAAPLTDISVVTVDDEPDTLRLTSLVLQREGATVVSVASAAHALSALKDRRPDILVTDIGMPLEDGYHLLEAVRGLPGFSNLPAIAFTARSSEAEALKARRAGFAAVLCKPVRPAVLVAQIAALTHRHAAAG